MNDIILIVCGYLGQVQCCGLVYSDKNGSISAHTGCPIICVTLNFQSCIKKYFLCYNSQIYRTCYMSY